MDDLHKHDPKYKKLDSGDHIVIIYLDATPFLLDGHDRKVHYSRKPTNGCLEPICMGGRRWGGHGANGHRVHFGGGKIF